MNKYLKYFMFAAVIGVCFVAGNAMADLGSGDNVFDTVLSRMVTTFKNVRSVIFVVGGFGLVGLGFGAIFGKVKWSWLAALAVGLAIVAIAGAVVDYVTQADSAQEAGDTSSFDDTLY